MSTTSSLKVAMQYSASENSLLLRVVTKNFMVPGPEISFLLGFEEPSRPALSRPAATDGSKSRVAPFGASAKVAPAAGKVAPEPPNDEDKASDQG